MIRILPKLNKIDENAKHRWHASKVRKVRMKQEIDVENGTYEDDWNRGNAIWTLPIKGEYAKQKARSKRNKIILWRVVIAIVVGAMVANLLGYI